MTARHQEHDGESLSPTMMATCEQRALPSRCGMRDAADSDDGWQDALTS